MKRRETIWSLIWMAGLWMLTLGLEMIPALALVMPEIIRIMLSTEALTIFSKLLKLAFYFFAAFYFISRGEKIVRYLT